MDCVSGECYSIPSAQLHTRGSWWQDDVPCAGHFKSPYRIYITDTVIGWHRCLCVPIIPHNSQLEKSWPPRALAYPQLRSEKINITTSWYLQSAGRRGHTVAVIQPAKFQLNLQLWTLSANQTTLLILNFNCPQLTESAIQMAETFLVKCLKPSTDMKTFDDLRIAPFDSNVLKMDFERTACTSTNARKHIQRAYYQQQLWVQAPCTDAISILNADAYGFVRKGSL